MTATRLNRRDVPLLPLTFAGLGVVLAWGLYWLCASQFLERDVFEPFNALVTALGFAAVLYTLHLQRKQIKRQATCDALAAELDALIQIYNMSDEVRRDKLWDAIRHDEKFPLERAIVTQIACLDRLAIDANFDHVPAFPARNTRDESRSNATSAHPGGESEPPVTHL